MDDKHVIPATILIVNRLYQLQIWEGVAGKPLQNDPQILKMSALGGTGVNLTMWLPGAHDCLQASVAQQYCSRERMHIWLEP